MEQRYWNTQITGKTAVVLLNFGGPREAAEVEGFLYEILRDPNTIQLPFPQLFQNILARRIARKRSPETAAQYAEIGGGSPIVPATETIAEGLRSKLTALPSPPPVFVAHRYIAGWCAATAREVFESGAQEVLAIPLYPHFSFATTGSSLEQLSQALRDAGFAGQLRSIRSYPDAPQYLEALSNRLEATLADAGCKAEETVVLCSAHGLPVSYVRRGDPYPLELYRTIEGLAGRFPQWQFLLSYQSRVGPAEWLKPYTDEVLAELADDGAKHLVFLPLSFVNDHIETLFEIGHTYFGMAQALGMTPHLVPAIEDHPAHIGFLAEQTQQWLQGSGGVKADELLPPDQSFARTGRWALILWLISLFAAGWIALV